MTAKRVAIIGAGAVGGVTAAALHARGADVTLCARRPFAALVVETDGQAAEVPVRVVTDPGTMAPVDWILLATKAQDTPGAAAWFEALVGPGTVIAVLQNGVDHVERVSPFSKGAAILPVVVYAPGETVKSGHVRAHGKQKYLVPPGAAGAAFVRLFEGSAIDVREADDFLTAAWRKLLANVSANPITALTTCRIGIMNDPEIRQLAQALLREAVTVARAVGAGIDYGEIDPILDSYAHLDANWGTSMLYDRIAGHRMEHEFLTGSVVAKAAELGVEVPFNRAILALLRGVQSAMN